MFDRFANCDSGHWTGRQTGGEMSDIEDFEQRISRALARIGAGIERVQTPSAPIGKGDSEALQTALDDERQVTAQLEERVKSLRDRQDHAIAEMKAEAAVTATRMTQLDMDLQRLRRANEQLTSTIEALRTANEAGVGEPHLINKAMMAELEALRASRATDVAEADAILGALTPLVAKAAKEQEESA